MVAALVSLFTGLALFVVGITNGETGTSSEAWLVLLPLAGIFWGMGIVLLIAWAEDRRKPK